MRPFAVGDVDRVRLLSDRLGERPALLEREGVVVGRDEEHLLDPEGHQVREDVRLHAVAAGEVQVFGHGWRGS